MPFTPLCVTWHSITLSAPSQLQRATRAREGIYPLQVRTMDLNDELGQITHVFSDKTGTFTLNYMEFRKMSIGGVAYGRGTTCIGLDRMEREKQDTTEMKRIMAEAEAAQKANVRAGRGSPPLPRPRAVAAAAGDWCLIMHVMSGAQPNRVEHVNFDDGTDVGSGRTLLGDLGGASGGAQAEAIHRSLLHMLLNHTVVPEVMKDDMGKEVGRRLSASSPDEEAFVCACQYFGYVFITRAGNMLIVEIKGVRQTFECVMILPYTQMRKRMGVVIRDPDGRLFLYVKGADSTLFERLRQSDTESPEAAACLATQRQLTVWGNDGLRTLVFAYRPIADGEFARFRDEFMAANSDLTEKSRFDNKLMPNAVDNAMDAFESGLVLQAATANEDKLQVCCLVIARVLGC